jgi:hypothetical protein
MQLTDWNQRAMARQQYIRDRDRDVPARPQSPAHSWFAAGFNAVVSIVLAVAALVTVFFAWRASQESRRAADLAQQAVLAVRAADEADKRDRKIRQLREIGLLTESIQKLASRQQLTDSVGVGVGVGERLLSEQSVLARWPRTGNRLASARPWPHDWTPRDLRCR